MRNRQRGSLHVDAVFIWSGERDAEGSIAVVVETHSVEVKTSQQDVGRHGEDAEGSLMLRRGGRPEEVCWSVKQTKGSLLERKATSFRPQRECQTLQSVGECEARGGVVLNATVSAWLS